MATISLSVETDPSGAITGIKQFTGEVEKMGKKGKKASDKLRKSLKQLSDKAGTGLKSLIKTTLRWGTVLGGLAGTLIIGKVIKASANLEAAMLGVRKTTGLSASAIKDLRNEFIEISKSSPVTASELAAIGEVAGQLGIQGKKDILEFTQTISQIAVTTDLTAEEAAVSMAQLKNVLGEPIENVKLLGSVMNELSNTTVATARDITDLSLRMGGAAKTLGLTSAEVMAFAATMRDAGVSVEVGGTAMSQVFTKMLVDTEKFANVAGVSFDEFSTMIKTKPVEAIKLFITQLSKMETFKKAEAIKSLGLEGVRIVGVISKLSDNMAGLNKNLETANDEFERGTSLQKEFDIFIQGTSSQLRMLGNRLGEVAFEIGDTLLPIINDLIKTAGDDLVETLKGVAKWFTNNREEVRRLVAEGYREFKEITKELVNILKALGTPLSATVGLFRDLAGLFTGTVSPARMLRNEIKLLEKQILTGTQLEKGFLGFSKVVKATPEDLKRMNRQLEFFKNRLKEVEGAKKTFTTIRLSITKTIEDLKDNGKALRDVYIRAFGDLEAGYKGQIKGIKTISKELKKLHTIKSKLTLQSLALEKRSILEILKKETVGLAKRKKLSKQFILIIRKQEELRKKIIRVSATEQLKEFTKTSDEAKAIKANELLAIKNLEIKTAMEITQFKKTRLKEDVKNSIQANLDILNDFHSTIAQKREALDNLKDKNLDTAESFKAGWKDAMIGPNGFKSSTQMMWELGSQVFNDLRTAQRALTDTIFQGGNIMKSVWKGVGMTVENLGKQAFANAMDIIIEKTMGSAAAAMGMGAGTAAGWGSAKGGAWGAAAEVAIYLATAAASFAAGKAIAKFAHGGMTDDLGRVGLIQKGTGPRSDDVRVRNYPNTNIMASRGEFIINADATKENLSLLELINQSKKNVLGFGGGGFFGSVGGALGGVIGNIAKIGPEQTFDERVNFLADILTAGGALSFLHGWLKAGDWIQGIPPGVSETVGYAVSTLVSAGVAKEANFLFRKDGGEIGGCGDCASCGKKNECFGFGGFFKKALGIPKKIVKAPLDLTSKAARILPGGDMVADVLDNVGECVDTLADPKKMINLMVKKFFETTRKPAVPVAKAILTPRTGMNIELDFFSDLINDALSLDMFKNMLGPCSPEKIVGLAEGTPFVPFDMIAKIHKGERVVPAEQNKFNNDMEFNAGGGTTINLSVENLFAKDINQIIDEINEDNSDRNIGDFRLTVERQNTENYNLASF